MKRVNAHRGWYLTLVIGVMLAYSPTASLADPVAPNTGMTPQPAAKPVAPPAQTATSIHEVRKAARPARSTPTKPALDKLEAMPLGFCDGS